MARITNALRHVHKYFRMPETGLWYCAGMDGCTHYMPKNMPPPAGRMSVCWGPNNCSKQFMLTPYNMRNDKPMCDKCEEIMEVINESNDDFFSPSRVSSIKSNPIKSSSQVQSTESEHMSDCASWLGLDCDCRELR